MIPRMAFPWEQRRQAVVNELPIGTALHFGPPDEDRPCDVDCAYTWVRGVSVTRPRVSSSEKQQYHKRRFTMGRPVLLMRNETAMSHEWKWNDWGDCGSAGYGKHNRTVTILTPCFAANNCPDGYLHGGDSCPEMETKVCSVDCVSEYEEWTPCDKSTGEQSGCHHHNT